jgi:hypothetical protein
MEVVSFSYEYLLSHFIIRHTTWSCMCKLFEQSRLKRWWTRCTAVASCVGGIPKPVVMLHLSGHMLTCRCYSYSYCAVLRSNTQYCHTHNIQYVHPNPVSINFFTNFLEGQTLFVSSKFGSVFILSVHKIFGWTPCLRKLASLRTTELLARYLFCNVNKERLYIYVYAYVCFAIYIYIIIYIVWLGTSFTRNTLGGCRHARQMQSQPWREGPKSLRSEGPLTWFAL